MEFEKTKKILTVILAISIIVIIGGIIVVAKQGFCFDLHYQGGKRIEIELGQTVQKKEIEEISKEVLGENVQVRVVEVYEQEVSILAPEITEEQRNTIVTKINEKYGLELEAEKNEILVVPNTRFRDIIRPYVIPVVVTTAIILVYIGFRFIKKTNAEILLETIGAITVGQALLFSIIAIARIPVGRWTLPLALIVYILSTIFCTARLETYIALQKEIAESNEPA